MALRSRAHSTAAATRDQPKTWTTTGMWPRPGTSSPWYFGANEMMMIELTHSSAPMTAIPVTLARLGSRRAPSRMKSSDTSSTTAKTAAPRHAAASSSGLVGFPPIPKNAP